MMFVTDDDIRLADPDYNANRKERVKIAYDALKAANIL